MAGSIQAHSSPPLTFVGHFFTSPSHGGAFAKEGPPEGRGGGVGGHCEEELGLLDLKSSIMVPLQHVPMSLRSSLNS